MAERDRSSGSAPAINLKYYAEQYDKAMADRKSVGMTLRLSNTGTTELFVGGVNTWSNYGSHSKFDPGSGPADWSGDFAKDHKAIWDWIYAQMASSYRSCPPMSDCFGDQLKRLRNNVRGTWGPVLVAYAQRYPQSSGSINPDTKEAWTVQNFEDWANKHMFVNHGPSVLNVLAAMAAVAVVVITAGIAAPAAGGVIVSTVLPVVSVAAGATAQAIRETAKKPDATGSEASQEAVKQQAEAVKKLLAQDLTDPWSARMLCAQDDKWSPALKKCQSVTTGQLYEGAALPAILEVPVTGKCPTHYYHFLGNCIQAKPMCVREDIPKEKVPCADGVGAGGLSPVLGLPGWVTPTLLAFLGFFLGSVPGAVIGGGAGYVLTKSKKG